MNGLDTQRKILEFQPKIKTVIITAYSDFNFAQEAIKLQVADFLLKPVPPDDLYECLDRVLRQLSSSSDNVNRSESPDSAIKKALDYMHGHYLEGLRIADVAEKVNLSEKYFSRYFRQRTGRSFTDQLNVLLVNKAKQLLLNSSDPVYKIAMDLGFSDVAYFIKVFRKYEEMTPAKFRQNRDPGLNK
jgi:YesN/AraC family two-component response regulator